MSNFFDESRLSVLPRLPMGLWVSVSAMYDGIYGQDSSLHLVVHCVWDALLDT